MDRRGPHEPHEPHGPQQRGRGSGRGALRASLAVLGLALLAVLLVACRQPRPGWTFAPPQPTPSAIAGATTPSPAAPSATPSSSPSPSPSPTPAPTPSPAPTPIPAGRAAVEVPILYYHRIIAPPRGFRHWPRARRELFLAYDVVPAAFEAQLDWLQARGYTTILPADLAAYWDRGVPLPPNPVMITFDDGTHDWASTVLDALRARGMRAEFYVTLQSLHSGGMSWGELRELLAAGNGIGAHGLHHQQLAGLPGRRRAVPEDVMWREVTRPRTLLLERLGIVPDSYAYVGGGFDATLERLVEAAGYTTARSIRHGRTQHVDQRFTLRVVRVGPGTDVVDPVSGTLVPGLPHFTRLMLGRS